MRILMNGKGGNICFAEGHRGAWAWAGRSGLNKVDFYVGRAHGRQSSSAAHSERGLLGANALRLVRLVDLCPSCNHSAHTCLGS